MHFLPAFVHTYNAGLCFALLLFFFFLGLLHYCPISQCFQHIAPLPGSLARQPCLAALPGSQIPNTAQNTALLSTFTMLSAYCTIACTLAMQPCPAALPGSLARQPCPAAFHGSLARQPYPAALTGSLAKKFGSYFTAVGRHACSIAYFYLAGSLVQAFPAIKDIAILSLAYKLISTCEHG
jgi:hypothetical protein